MSCENGHSGCNGRNLDQEEKMMKECGFFCHMVFNDSEIPSGANLHSHGFPETLNHPDIQITFPIPPEVYGPIIHSLYDWIKEGNEIELERAYDNILKGMSVQYAWAIENGRDVLRMILPDKNGETMKELMDEPYVSQWTNTFLTPQVGKLEE